jgi:hypothetical protein
LTEGVPCEQGGAVRGGGGGSVLVEVDEDTFGVERVARDKDVLIQSGKTLQTVLDTIRWTARAVLDELPDLKPDETQVQFGLKLNAETQALIAKAGAEGQLTSR